MPYYRCAPCGLTSYSAAGHSTANVCPNCSAAMGEDEKLNMTSGFDHAATRVLAARPAAVAEARRVVGSLALPVVTREKLSLLVSELTTNAVLHTELSCGSPIGLEITVRAGRVRIAVHDLGQGFAWQPADHADPFTVGGQGLIIVAALSENWGVVCEPEGCTVWCEVMIDEEPSAAIDRRVTGAYVHELAVEMATPAAVIPP